MDSARDAAGGNCSSAAGSSVCVLFRKHASSGAGHFADRKQAHPKPLVRFLLLDVSILPGGRWNRGVGGMDESPGAVGNVAAGAAGGLRGVPVVSSLSGKAGG